MRKLHTDALLLDAFTFQHRLPEMSSQDTVGKLLSMDKVHRNDDY